ncbi:MAG: diguanylate cyclase [Synechococcales cyanobacterium T60_A2020_003]|nr:diguanylate cyclase [Synechococcales cyanobacterium T60_A2020_003]
MTLQYFNPEEFLILVVDDHADNLKVLRIILEIAGYRLTFARSGTQALDRIHTLRPDLILLDLVMPDIDGLEVCKRLQETPECAAIPIIFITASDEIEHLVKAFAAGAVDYITKPFSQPELLARVRTHLELKLLRDRALRQFEQERIVSSITHGIHHSLNLATVLQTAVSELLPFLNADRVLIGQFTDDRCYCLAEELTLAAGDRLLKTDLPLQKIPLQSVQFQQWSMDAAMPENWSDSHRDWMAQYQVKAALVVPIVQEQQIWGVLLVHYHQEHAWANDEMAVLLRIVDQLAIAIQHSTLHEQLQNANRMLQQVANTDGLTQLANRRHFDEYFAQEWARSQREDALLSFLLCDIDYFKQYNDHYGHPQGDWCLQQVAQVISSVINRPADLVARYGGEEFAVLLPQTGIEGATRVAQNIQQAIDDLKIPHDASAIGHILTLSIGIASVHASKHLCPQDLIESADHALYEAKSGGRNRYVVGSCTYPRPSVRSTMISAAKSLNLPS